MLSFAVFTSAEAAETQGRLIDKLSGAPVANAEVLVIGTNVSVRTDADGRFTLSPDPAVPFELLVILPGGQVAKPVRIERVDASGVMNIEVESVLETSTTVTGVAPSIDTSPGAAMTMLSGLEVSSRNPANLLQSLENVPGVNQVSEGQAAAPAVRGLAQGRTLLLIDGGRVTSERRVGPSATFLDPAVIGGVDVARGPGSVAYGSDAFGGVISVRTKRTALNAPLSVKVTGTTATGIPDRRASVAMTKGFSSGSLLAQFHVRKAEDYDGPDGPVLNSGWRDTGFLIKGERISGSSIWSLGWQSDMARDVERPRNNSATTRFYYPFENSHRLTAGYETSGLAGLSQLRVTGFFGSSDQRTDQDSFGTATKARSVSRSDITAKDFGLRAIAERSTGRTKFEFGLDLNGRFGLETHEISIGYDLAGAQTSLSDALATEDARKTDTGIFGQITTTIAPRVDVSAGLRGDIVKNRNIGGYFGDRDETNTSASGFVSATIGAADGFSVTGQVARGARDPRLSDLYYRGPTGRGYITGNPDLDPERSLQFDLGLHYSAGAIRVGMYGYRYDISHLIERYETTQDFFFFRNRGKARVQGVEVEMQAVLGRGLSLEMSGQLTDGKALDDDAPLDDLSPGSISVVLRQQIRDRGHVFVRAAAHGKLDDPGPNERVAPGYTLVDAAASWRFSPNLELRAAARNLLNSSYHASPSPRWVFAPGRNAALTAVVGF